jgi:UDP-glucose 4-epimerase
MSMDSGIYFAGAHCLITGGLGFIGSNLAMRLVASGAHVTLVDAMIPEYGGNLFNIEPVRERVTLNFGDICDAHAMDCLVRGQDYVFHLAGQVSHVLGLSNPFPDIEFNIRGTAVILEALRRFNPGARLVFTGTRGQYGPAARLPVDEEAPTHPKGMYEISNLAAEKIVKFYNDVHGIRSVLLRLTNVYGPRAQMKHADYGVVNWFVRQAIDGEPIQVFGDGSILRDFLYVEDCVDALLLAAAVGAAMGEVLNVGGDRPASLRELAEMIVGVAGSGRWEFAPFTPERKAQEPGDFYSDISKIRRLLGWQPCTDLEHGLQQTVAYYRAYRRHYW